MKEAAGEANLTVVAIILIGVIAAVVTPIITSMMENTKARACCNNAGGTYKSGGKCTDIDGKSLTGSTAYTQCMAGSSGTN
jgi:putative effector of murein hydrolase